MNMEKRSEVLQAAAGHFENALGAGRFDENVGHLAEGVAWLESEPELAELAEKAANVRDLAVSGHIEFDHLEEYVNELRNEMAIERTPARVAAPVTHKEPISIRPLIPIGFFAVGALVAWTLTFPMLLEGAELPIWKPIAGVAALVLAGILGLRFAVRGVEKLPRSEKGLSISLAIVGLYQVLILWTGTDVAKWILESESWILWKILPGICVLLLGLVVFGEFCRLAWFFAQNERRKANGRRQKAGGSLA
jgi:hypothetical protein